MKVYVDENDIKRNIITYCNGTNTQQGLYVYGKDKIEVLSLTDYTKQVRKEVLKEIKEKLKGKEIFHPEDEFEIDYDFYYKEDVEEILDQLQGE